MCEPISFGIVDRGLYPGSEVAGAHPLLEECNLELTEFDNSYRLRAACVQILEASTNQGHTILPTEEIGKSVRDLSVINEIPLDAEIIDICREDFAPVVSVIGDGDGMLLQLDRYVSSGEMLRAAVEEKIAWLMSRSRRRSTGAIW